MSGQERLLHGVLRLLDRSEQMAGEREQSAVVAIEENLEGGLVAVSQVLDEPLVARSGEKRPRPQNEVGDGCAHVAGMLACTSTATTGSDLR